MNLDEVKEHLKASEAVKYEVYDDGKGIPTIGVGYALIVKNANGKWVINPQIETSESQDKILSLYVSAKNNGMEAPPKSTLSNFGMKWTEAQVNEQLDKSITDHQNRVVRSIGQEAWDKMTDRQKFGVFDHCYNYGNVERIKNEIKEGNYKAAADKLREYGVREKTQANLIEFSDFCSNGNHCVQKDETAGKIASNHGLTLDQLKNLNPDIKNWNQISIGQEINIGKATEGQKENIKSNTEYHTFSTTSSPGYTIESGDTLWKIAKKNGMTVSKLLSIKGNEHFKSNPHSIKPGDVVYTEDQKPEAKHTGWEHIPEEPKTGYSFSDYAGGFSNWWNKGGWGFGNWWGGNNGGSGSGGGNGGNNGGGGGGFMRDVTPPKIDPLYIKYDPFKINTPSSSSFITEPPFLYLNNRFGLNNYYSEYLSARSKFASDVNSCLSSSFCIDSVSSLANRAASSASFTNSWQIKLQLEREAPSLAIGATSFYNLYAMDRKSGMLGSWTHTLRKELGYAASHVSPLVLDLNGDGVKLFSYSAGVYFDIDNDEFAERIGWLSGDDGQLAIDLNNNGKIDDITELFGDDLIPAFKKLSLFDSNDDQIIDENDEGFNDLLVWQDKNSNGYTEEGELKTLKEVGIKSISIKTKTDSRVIEGNTINEVSSFTYEDGRVYEVADVHYHNDDMDSWYKGKPEENTVNQQYKNRIIQNFKNQIVFEIRDKINDPQNIKNEKDKDWIAELIKIRAEEFIVNYKKEEEQKEKELKDTLNKNASEKIKSNIKKAQAEQMKIIVETELKYEEKIKELHQKLAKEAQIKFDEEEQAEKIYQLMRSKYWEQYKKDSEAFHKLKQEEFTRERTSLFNKINEEFKGVLKYITSKDTAEFYQEKKQKEYKEQREALKNRIENEVKAKHDQLYAEYQVQIKAINKLENEEQELVEQQNDEISEKIYGTKENINKLGEGIKSIIRDQYIEHKHATEHVVNSIQKAIKSEANKLHDFFVSFLEELAKEEDLNLILPLSLEEIENELLTFKNNKETEENELNGVKIDPETLFMPLLRGYGNLPALHIAMSKNAALKKLVTEFMELKGDQFASFQEKLVDILYEWSEVSNIPENARATAGGVNIEARKVEFVEQMTGQDFRQLGAAKFVGQHASTAVQKAWDIALIRTARALMVQGPLMSIFPKAEYIFAEDQIKFNSSLTEILDAAKEYSTKYKLGYDFWVNLGYILSLNLEELNCTIDALRGKLSDLAGESILISAETFVLVGDDNDNIIKGSVGSDYIKGKKGNDKLYGNDASDYLEGDEGDDELYGGKGIDRLHGGDGNDKIYGGEDRDFIYGDEGNDEIYGEEGNDHIEGGAGADTMDGGEGENTLSYGRSQEAVRVNLATGDASGGDASGDKFKNFVNLGGSEYNDHLTGDDKDNYINGEGGDDYIYGGKGNDDLFGATGEDHLYGEEGDDTLSGFEGIDHMDGGEGEDTVSYHHPYATTGVQVNLESGKGVSGYAQGDTYKNIENISGSKFDDVLIGDQKDNVIRGMEGNDIIRGGGGNDVLIGDSGYNKLYGESGDDKFILGMGDNEVEGGDGIDTVSYQYSNFGVTVDLNEKTGQVGKYFEDTYKEIENAIGSNYNDHLTGDEKNNRLVGLDGDDIIEGGEGDDIIAPGEGKDIVNGGEGKDTVDYSSETKEAITIDLKKIIVKGGSAEGDKLISIENVVGTKFNDSLTGDNNDNMLNGYDGDDIIHGGKGSDVLVGGKGKNELYGEEGNDELFVGEGENIANGGEGRDTVNYSNAKGPVKINLQEKKGEKSNGLTDSFIEIENAMGSIFDDHIIGDEEDNHLYGNDGNDIIEGGEGSDTINGGKGNNKLFGGKGSDNFKLIEGNNIVDGGEGSDTVTYIEYREKEYKIFLEKEERFRKEHNALPAVDGQEFTELTMQGKGFTISLKDKTAQKNNNTQDSFTSIENVTGTYFDDVIIGDEENNSLNGIAGNDIIKGGDGNDIISAGKGKSQLYGEEGNDRFVILEGEHELDGGEGQDIANFYLYSQDLTINLTENSIVYGSSEPYKFIGIENIKTGDYNDIIYDGSGNYIIETGSGNDQVHLKEGNVHLDTGDGNDIIYISGSGRKTITSGYGADIYFIKKDFNPQDKISVLITDFDLKEDRIDLTQYPEISSLKDLTFELINDKDMQFTIVGFGLNKALVFYDLHQTDFIFDHFIFA